MKDNNNSVLQWMERRRRTGFFMDEANPILPQRPILMTKTEAFKLNKQLRLRKKRLSKK